MKISVNWLKQFTDINIPTERLIEKIGSQLGAVDEVVNLGDKYKDAVIVKVIECYKHPNADKLSICLIDDNKQLADIERNEAGMVQVVCGASNIAKDQTVVWLPPGSTVPETFNDDQPFILDTREIRGIKSNGMIASSKELSLGDDHSGILVIEEDVKPGTSLVEFCQLDDVIIDIENKMFTHRPDCFGMLGIAREVSGILGQQFESPKWYLESGTRKQEPENRNQTSLPLHINNELPDLVPRFVAVSMSNVQVKPSPLTLQTYLSRVGIRPINNIVDITNYLMLLTAQPLHAYDYDKVLAQDSGAHEATLATRLPKSKEKLTLLNGKTIEPHNEAILITTDTKTIGLGGVMGGGDTEVDTNTKNIIIECASFDMYSIRKTAMEHGVFTDAVTRFNKGQSPWQNMVVIRQAIEMVGDLASGKMASQIIDENKAQIHDKVRVSKQFINDRLGLNLEVNQIANTLTNVEFTVEQISDELVVNPPYWRMDIAIPEDIVEEVGRLIGFDELPLELPSRDLIPAKTNNLLDLKNQTRQILQSFGANELLTYSFIHGNLIDNATQDKELAFKLVNALSPDLQYYRLSLLPSLLEKVHPNIKTGNDVFALFEIGKGHIKDWTETNGVPLEAERLALVFAANGKTSHHFGTSSYFQAKEYVIKLLTQLAIDIELEKNLDNLKTPIEAQMIAPFSKDRSALIKDKNSGKLIGVIGEINQVVSKSLKLPVFCAGFEIDISTILSSKGRTNYIVLPKYPKVEQDITLKVNIQISNSELTNFIVGELNKMKLGECDFELKTMDIFQKDDDKSNKQITFRLRIASYDRTLTAQEVNNLLDEIAVLASSKFNAQRI